MTHDFSNLSAVLTRCSEQVAEQVIAEVSAAIADAAQGQQQPSTGLTKMHFALKKAKAAQAAERRAKAAAFLFDNPALPLPRAQRRALERELRKHRRHSA